MGHAIPQRARARLDAVVFYGARIVFSDPMVEQEWCCQKVAYELRVVILMCAMLYHENNAARLRVLRIFAQEPMYRYGRSADVGVLEIPGVNRAKEGDPYHRVPAWIATRLNLLFPFGDGELETAEYTGSVISLRVPFNGFQQEAAPLSMWREWGASGHTLTPRKVRLNV